VRTKGLNSRDNIGGKTVAITGAASFATFLDKARADGGGHIDVLINNAGVMPVGPFLDLTDQAIRSAIEVNFYGVLNGCRLVLPDMVKWRDGHVVNIASGAGSVRGIPNRYVYGATKAAVIGLTKAVAADFIRKGIRSNAICPGTIESPSLDDRIETLARDTNQPVEKVRQAFVDRQAIGRLGKPEEVAAMAVYLGGDEASYTTGQIFLVDGGFAL